MMQTQGCMSESKHKSNMATRSWGCRRRCTTNVLLPKRLRLRGYSCSCYAGKELGLEVRGEVFWALDNYSHFLTSNWLIILLTSTNSR